MTNLIVGLVILLTPIALIYCWYFYFTRMVKEAGGWRSKVTLLSLVMVSIVLILWLPMMMLTPEADWKTGAGVAHQVQWVSNRLRTALYTLVGTFVICFLGRPRLIVPTAIACVGTALLWVSSTME